MNHRLGLKVDTDKGSRGGGLTRTITTPQPTKKEGGHCLTCDIQFKNQNEYSQHMNSSRHKNRVEARAKRTASPVIRRTINLDVSGKSHNSNPRRGEDIRPPSTKKHRSNSHGRSAGSSPPPLTPHGFLVDAIQLSTVPVVGLSNLTELRDMRGHNKSLRIFYLCGSCEILIPAGHIMRHLCGTLHRRDYLVKRYSHMMDAWKEASKRGMSSQEEEALMLRLAKKCEDKEGRDPSVIKAMSVEQSMRYVTSRTRLENQVQSDPLFSELARPPNPEKALGPPETEEERAKNAAQEEGIREFLRNFSASKIQSSDDYDLAMCVIQKLTKHIVDFERATGFTN